MKFKVSILNFLMLAALSFVPLHIAYSQTSDTASILPPAKTTFFDKNGKPLAAGTVDFYIPGTTTRKMTWQDASQTIPNTNPVVLDTSGRGLILGDGSYRQVVKDKDGNVIWDQVTSSTGSGGGGGGTPTVGDGDPVGIVKVWGGFSAPYQYVFAYGQELVRGAYPEAYAALTSVQNVSCTIGSDTLTGVADTSQLPVGAPIESACLNAGSTIVSKTVNTITASSVAIISSTTSARFFPYGNGDGSNTFNIPDLRGRVVAGRDNMGGITANRLNFALGIGAASGAQFYNIKQSDLPNVSTTFTGAPMTATTPLPTGVFAGSMTETNAGPGTSGVYGVGNSPGIGFTGISNSFTPAGTISSINGNVTQTSTSLVQPTQVYNYIIKVLPDTNPNTFFGVASIGGMYGVLECGTGLNCSGNTISASNTISGVSSVGGMQGDLLCGSGLTCSGGTITASGGIAGMYNITDFGAVCDGVTDDTSAINNAIASVPAGSTLSFPSTVCLIGSLIGTGNPHSITIDKSLNLSFNNGGGLHQTVVGSLLNIEADNVTISGASNATLTGPLTGTTYATYSNAIVTNNEPVVSGSTTRRNNIVVRGMQITNFQAWGIALWYCDNCIITSNKVTNISYGGIGCFACTNVLIDKNRVQNIWSSTYPAGGPSNITDHYGITVSSNDTTQTSLHSIVSNNIVDNVPQWQCYDAHNGNNILFVNNIGTRCLLGLSLGTGSIASANLTDRVVVEGNAFTCNTVGAPVYSGGPNTAMSSAAVRVSGLSSSALASNVTIKGNSFTACGSSNIAVAGDYGTIHAIWVAGLTIEGNNIYLGKYRGITISQWVWGTIKNNNFTSLVAGPAAVGAYLIDIVSTANWLNIGGNTATGSGYYGYNIVAQGAGYGVGISRDNMLSGATANYVGSSASNRTDLGATAP